MSRPDQHHDLDARAAAAAADLHRRSAARAIPAFTPSDDLAAAPGAPGRHPHRRPLLAAAAIVVAAAAVTTVVAVRDRGGDQRGSDAVVTGGRRAFEATHLPAGFVPIGAGEDQGGSVDPGSTPLAVYGPSPDDPQVGVAGIHGWSVAGGEQADARPPFEVGGVRARDVSDLGLGRHGVLIDDPASPGDAIVAVSPTLEPARLVALASATSTTGGRARIAPSALPDGWTRIVDDPSGVFAGSPIASDRAAVPSRVVAYAPRPAAGTAAPPPRLVTVAVRAGDEIDVAAARVTAGQVESVVVRGHDALLVTASGPASAPTSLTVSWVESPGEILRVTGLGIGRDELLAIAESVRALDAGQWRDLTDRAKLGLLDSTDGTLIARGSLDDGTAWALRSTGEGGGLDVRAAFDSHLDGVTASGSSSGGSTAPLRATATTRSGTRQVLAALVGPEVATVQVRRADGTGLVSVRPRPLALDAAVAAEVGPDVAGASYVVVELPADADRLVALDRTGAVVDSQQISLTDQVSGQTPTTLVGN